MCLLLARVASVLNLVYRDVQVNLFPTELIFAITVEPRLTGPELLSIIFIVQKFNYYVYQKSEYNRILNKA